MNCNFCRTPNQEPGGFCTACSAQIDGVTAKEAAPLAIDAITSADLATRTLAPTPHVVQGLIPRGLTILAGRPKSGKSWFSVDLAISVASGLPWHDSPVDTGRVMYLALEDTHARLQERIGKMTDAPPAALWLATTCEGGIVALAAWIEEHRPKLVVIDTFQRLRGHKASSYSRDYSDGARLKAIADKYSLGILLVHHTTKIKPANPLDSVSGSTGLTGAADAILVLGTAEGRGALWMTGRDVPTRILPLFWANYRWQLAAQHKMIAGPAAEATMPALSGDGSVQAVSVEPVADESRAIWSRLGECGKVGI